MPGAEFRVAYEEAMKYGGKVILGDRPVQVRCFAQFERLKILSLNSGSFYNILSLSSV